MLCKYAVVIAQQQIFVTETGNKRNIKQVMESKWTAICPVLPALHAVTGCDPTGALVRRGKVTPLGYIEKHQEYLPVFGNLGKDTYAHENLFRDLERFVCCMYGKSKYTDANKFRYDTFAQKFQGRSGQSRYDGVNLNLLQPCKGSLEMHIKRVITSEMHISLIFGSR